MAVPTSSITIRHIYNEINGTSHGANAQIGSGVTMSSLNAASNAYTSGTANHTGVNTTNNVEVTPDTIAEWASYVHGISMGTISYAVRISTAQSSWGLNQISSDDSGPGDNARADGAILIWSEYDGTNTYVKARRFVLGALQGTRTDSGNKYLSSSSALSNATGGTTLITIPVDDVSIAATVTALSGTVINKESSTGPYSGQGSTIGSGSGESLLLSRGAEDAAANSLANGQGDTSEEFQTIFKVELTASKTGYITTDLINGVTNGGIIVDCHNSATAQEEEEEEEGE